MKCPYNEINENSQIKQDQRFLSRENKLLLLNILCSELQAASMIAFNKPVVPIATSVTVSKNFRKIFEVHSFFFIKNESAEAIALKNVLIALGFSKPPPDVTWTQIWTKVESSVKDLINKLPQTHLGKPLLSATLTAKQWSTLAKINKILYDDFRLRREMLLKRLDVTVQSFKWADRLKSKNDEITRVFETKRKELSVNPEVKLSDILAARDGMKSIF